MNILLVRPKPHKRTINLQSFMICEPLELEILAAHLEACGHNTDIADLIISKKSIKHFLKKKNYSIVAFTSYLPHVGIVKRYAQTVKQLDNNIATIVGGVHAEVVPEDFVSDYIDFIVSANGAENLPKIADLIDNSETKDSIIGKIKGIYSPGRPKEAINTKFRTLPPLRQKTMQYRDKYNYIFHTKCATLKTSFGCPFNCSFCFCVQITGHKYFERTLDDVMNEILMIEEKNIFIVDDNFLSCAGRVNEFCAKLDIYGIDKKFILFGRADFVAANRECIINLKNHGLQAIFIGVESFTESELHDLNKKVDVETNIAAINFLDSIDIDVYSGIVCGINWRKADFDLLIDHMRQFKAPMPNIQPLLPVPGTPLFDEMKGFITLPRDKFELWDMAHLALKPQHMSKRAYYRNLMRAYMHTTASRKTRKYIRKKYGVKVYLRTLKGAVSIAWQYIKLIIKG